MKNCLNFQDITGTSVAWKNSIWKILFIRDIFSNLLLFFIPLIRQPAHLPPLENKSFIPQYPASTFLQISLLHKCHLSFGSGRASAPIDGPFHTSALLRRTSWATIFLFVRDIEIIEHCSLPRTHPSEHLFRKQLLDTEGIRI